ncbi:hypothetical protein M885DRAFT_614568, partial [Pelagophyceae sp. CCMP2097]
MRQTATSRPAARFDVRFESANSGRFSVDYGRWQLRWHFVGERRGNDVFIDDLIPLNGGLPDDDAAHVYAAFPLSALPSLALDGGAPASKLAADVAAAFHARQVSRAQKWLGGRAGPDLDAAAAAKRLCGVVVGAKHLEVVVDIFADAHAHDSSDGAVAEFSALLRLHGAPRVAVTYTPRGATVQVVSLPRASLPLTFAGFDAPQFQQGTSLEQYLQKCRTNIFDPWAQRRNLVQEIERRHVSVAADHAEYASVTIAFEHKDRQYAWICLLTFQIPAAFPLEAPVMTLTDYIHPTSIALDASLYRYSPRWDAPRIAAELLAHARSELPRAFHVAPPQKPTPPKSPPLPTRLFTALAREPAQK